MTVHRELKSSKFSSYEKPSVGMTVHRKLKYSRFFSYEKPSAGMTVHRKLKSSRFSSYEAPAERFPGRHYLVFLGCPAEERPAGRFSLLFLPGILKAAGACRGGCFATPGPGPKADSLRQRISRTERGRIGANREKIPLWRRPMRGKRRVYRTGALPSIRGFDQQNTGCSRQYLKSGFDTVVYFFRYSDLRPVQPADSAAKRMISKSILMNLSVLKRMNRRGDASLSGNERLAAEGVHRHNRRVA